MTLEETTNSIMKEDTIELLEEYKKDIDSFIRKGIKDMDPGIENLYESMLYHMNTGGKRWRPTLCLLVCEVYGEEMEKAMPLAACVELLHNFTLIHDDIEDGDTTRRNEPAVWSKYGLDHGINIGDGMREVAYSFLSYGREEWGDKIYADLSELVNTRVRKICEGQTMDMNFRGKKDIKEEDYLEMVKKKTGEMVRIAIEGSMIITGAPKEDRKASKVYSYSVGPAFQIQDDLLDYTEGKGREEIGCDVKEGKRSLMVVYALNNLPKKDKKELISILDKDREKTTSKDVSRAQELLDTCGAFEYAENKKEKLVKEARNVVMEYIPKSKAKSFMLGLTDFLVERSF